VSPAPNKSIDTNPIRNDIDTLVLDQELHYEDEDAESDAEPDAELDDEI
jgi:hypothetical protein